MKDDELRELFASVAAGRLTPDEAAASARAFVSDNAAADGAACLDFSREARCGLPEVVFALRKTPEQVVSIMRSLRVANGKALATRCSPETVELLKAEWPECRYYKQAAAVLIGDVPPLACAFPQPVVVSAGTSDGPVSEEAVATLALAGYEAECIQDVGVAGLHRLMRHLPALRAAPVVIVAAGMEGALPGVIGGLVSCPVIAVPTGVGYGASFGGVAALLGMLNACAAGVGVVNIDNGFGAGALAVRILHGLRRLSAKEGTPHEL